MSTTDNPNEINDASLKQLEDLLRKLGGFNFVDTPFPIWTESVDYPNQSASASGASGGAAAPGAEGRPDSARGVIGAVLGWRLNAADPRGFITALTRRFALIDDDLGNQTAKWVPPTYSVQSLEVGLGQITGAQASILAQARVAVEQVTPLIEGQRPLDEDADTEDVEAVRSLILAELTELVDQFGAEGGPVPQRVDNLFELLLGADAVPDEGDAASAGRVFELQAPEKVGGQLGLLRDRLGLASRRVNTMDEEERLTNFFIVVSNIDTLRLTWLAQRKSFRGEDASAFLGTQLVLLTRALSVVAESVQEVYYAMDSVFLGPSERQVLMLPTRPPITVAELLSWIEEVSSKKGIDIIRDSGKDGIIFAFAPIVNKLSALVDIVVAGQQAGAPSRGASQTGGAQGRRRTVRQRARNVPLPGAAVVAVTSAGGAPAPTGDTLPPGFYTGRVRVAWEGLAAHLHNVLRLVRPVRRSRPVVIEVTPDEGHTAQTEKRLAVDGEDFEPGARVKLTRARAADIAGKDFGAVEGLEGTDVVRVSGSQLGADFDLSKVSIPVGQTRLTLNVLVANPDGSETILEDAFTVNAKGRRSEPDTTPGPGTGPGTGPGPTPGGGPTTSAEFRLTSARKVGPTGGPGALTPEELNSNDYKTGRGYSVELRGRNLAPREFFCDFGAGVLVPSGAAPAVKGASGGEDSLIVEVFVSPSANPGMRHVTVIDDETDESSPALEGFFNVVRASGGSSS